MNAIKSSRPMMTARVDFLSSSLCIPFKDSCGLLLLMLMFVLWLAFLLLIFVLLLRELRPVCRRREWDRFRLSSFSRQLLSQDILRIAETGDVDTDDAEEDDGFFFIWIVWWRFRFSVDIVEADVLELS
jgi:hypothetical protein